MGVYIKNMKMPNGCISCPLKSYGTIDEFKYYCDMTGASLGEWCDKRLDKRHKDCPLVEVKTPHGRLIDAEDMSVNRYDNNVDEVETIIEGEDE